jgi:lipoprotein-anchoring transpeptidase ErfK/SrfK
MRNIFIFVGMVLVLATGAVGRAQYYNPYANPYQQYQQPPGDLQYDPRDAERILQQQVQASQEPQYQPQQQPQTQQQYPGGGYDNYYGHRINDEAQVRDVMQDARVIAGYVKQKNGKPFVIMDKRNYQFYLFDREGRLLRIGPVAIGKGKTHVGAFETPVGVFPITRKAPVDDWVRPDWYFVEEGEPIPKKYEDRRVPGFFRYKMVFDGSRYIHYAEATGGRLTHGCLGLDWEDAEAVFHTLQVGSYCIIIDQPFLMRLAKGEFPVRTAAAKKPEEPKKAEELKIAEKMDPEKAATRIVERSVTNDDKVLRSLW